MYRVSIHIRMLAGVMAFSTYAITAAADQAVDVVNVFSKGAVVDSKPVTLKSTHPADVQMCKGFDLDEEKIRLFFRYSDQVSSEIAGHYFDWAPCQVHGHFKYDNKLYPFSINAASTGVIQLAKDETVYFACKDKCKVLFDYGYGTTSDE
jgi:hypothetical protein